MVFSDKTQVIREIKKVIQVPSWVVEARKYHKEMKALIYGDDYKELLLQIEHIETTKKASARKKYSRPIKDINAKLLEPVSNVYSATGGGKEYNIKSESQKKDFLKQLANVRDGLSIERWLETYWSKDLYNVDPSGIMFLEWETKNEITKAYPTYKSIDSIRNYKSNGLALEFIIFNPKQIINSADVIWRVVDDEKEYLIKQSGNIFTETTDSPINHPFGICPGRVNSDKKRLGEQIRLAPIDSVIPNEKEILRDRSILTIHKFLNGFPISYRPALVCPSCHGTGKDGSGNCADCNGKGFLQNTDIVDEIILPIDLNAENTSMLPSNFAGHITLDLGIWNQYIEEGKRMFNELFETIWGTRESSEVKDQTAMGIILNTQPMTSRLNSWSEVAQSHEWAFTEMLANFYIPTKDKDERISIITYGRNYIIQPPEFLLEQYQKSKEKKDGATILDRKLTEYLTSKYKNDPSTLMVELRKKELEPYIHLDFDTVFKVYGQKEAQKKGLFTDWWETLSKDDILKPIEQLEINRDKYFETKLTGLETSQLNNQNE